MLLKQGLIRVMSEAGKETNIDKARAFFERAQEVAITDNFDYAIDMFIEGLRHGPDAVEDGHKALRRLSLIRQGKGGKKPSIKDKMAHHGGKTALDEMLNAEYLLAKDPDNISYAEGLLKAAVAGGYSSTALWIADLLYEAASGSDKPSFSSFILLKDAYTSLQFFSKAVSACQKALEIKPNDDSLKDELRDLTAQMTVQDGKYGQDGGFRDSIKDRESQDNLQSERSSVRSPEYRRKSIDSAREALAKEKNSVNIVRLANALCDTADESDFEEAMDILENAYAEYDDFSFKRLQGNLKIKKLQRDIRRLKVLVRENPGDEDINGKLHKKLSELSRFELEHYEKCIGHYPTDLGLKYEYGLRLMMHKEFDKAIPYLQDAQKDPKMKVRAMEKTGICFFMKGWYEDATEIFEKALEICKIKDSNIAKEIRYNLARSLEQDKKYEKALSVYRKLAQLDFSFQDVGSKVDKLREKVDKSA
jgi:tetratricopeptide (TPR) repeat protein